MLSYPLDLGFKIVTIGTRIRVTDATGRLVAYARKKKFKLKEDVGVYQDEDQSRLLFRMKPATLSAAPTVTPSGRSGGGGCDPCGAAPTSSRTRAAERRV